MKYERPDYEDKLSERAGTYRPETAEYLGHICRVGVVSAQAVIELLDVLDEDRRMNDRDLVDGIILTLDEDRGYYQSVLPAYNFRDAEGEALPPRL